MESTSSQPPKQADYVVITETLRKTTSYQTLNAQINSFQTGVNHTGESDNDDDLDDEKDEDDEETIE